MIEEKYIELIQAEVDGELPEHQRAEVSRYLLASPEARALRDDLRSLCAALERVPAAEPPPGLKGSILSAADVSAAVPAAPTRRNRLSWQPTLLRYAAVFAGGLLVGAAGWQAGMDRGSRMDLSDVAGTMASGDPASRSVPVDSFEVTLDQVGGTVSLFRSPSARVVQFDLDFRGAVEVIVAHDGEVARFGGLTGGAGGRSGRFALVVDGPGSPDSPVEVSFVVDGRTVQRGTLHVAMQH